MGAFKSAPRGPARRVWRASPLAAWRRRRSARSHAEAALAGASLDDGRAGSAAARSACARISSRSTTFAPAPPIGMNGPALLARRCTKSPAVRRPHTRCSDSREAAHWTRRLGSSLPHRRTGRAALSARPLPMTAPSTMSRARAPYIDDMREPEGTLHRGAGLCGRRDARPHRRARSRRCPRLSRGRRRSHRRRHPGRQ